MPKLDEQLNLICTQCPLMQCDTESLWCLLSFITKPNKAQKPILQQRDALRLERKRIKRRKYYSKYYMEHRDEKLKAANERHAKKREARLTTLTSTT